MDTSYRELIEDMIRRLDNIPYVTPEDLPQIDLYMDQVTTLMEEKLFPTRRSKDDKILTKTMINNYAKNHLLPPPVKKKYSRSHMLLLVYIYYLKGFLSLQDIQKIIGPLAKDTASDAGRFDMEQIYREVFSLQREQIPRITEDLHAILRINAEGFETDEDTDPSDREYLQVFSLICALAADVFVKKRIIEELIDSCL